MTTYIEYDYKCIDKFNRVFAFAIYDTIEKILFCARDRIEKKLFVYSEHATEFYFASNDIPSMMYSVALRALLLDHNVIDIAFKIRPQQKVMSLYRKKQ